MLVLRLDAISTTPYAPPVTLALAALLLVQAAVTVDRPADVVRQATRAVEMDSAAAAASGWRTALLRDPTTPRALLALATIERLTYDYAAADRHYATLTAPSPSIPAAFAAWATLGMAESRLFRLPLDSAAAWLVA